MSTMNRFWLFLYSTPNIVGTILGLIGLCLYFTGIIKTFWLPIVVGLYLAGYIGCPRSGEVKLRVRSDLEAAQIESELKELLHRVADKVLPEVYLKIQSITHLVIELLPRVKNSPQNRHTIVKTATDYLPSMLEHYLNLPIAFARFHQLKNGKTPREILIDQLTTLEEQLQRVAEDIHSGDTEALLAHARFLETKFGKDNTWEL